MRGPCGTASGFIRPQALPLPLAHESCAIYSSQSPFKPVSILGIAGKNGGRHAPSLQAPTHVDLLPLFMPHVFTPTNHILGALIQVGMGKRCPVTTPRFQESTPPNYAREFHVLCSHLENPKHFAPQCNVYCTIQYCDYIHSSSLFLSSFQDLTFSNTYKYARGLSARTLSASARTTFSSLKSTHEPPFSSVRMCAT